MAELIASTDIKREKGYLYFLKSDANGNLEIYKAVMCRGGRHKKKKDGQVKAD